ncbi:hypothetical protein EDB81DRAFT_875186 [Dactylonectria macrodidyma]|uniref:Nephrocystin 3-like N-terminal domain-containing protein n=1 Tax=Dactylonectria macrodidyma TaxID=307937 RepID=A0A9P9JRK4_9HYPO|nr:hypothetical protein EDB81DRAFT_875186 [Dactylonectria macrodidyma]
MAQSLQRDLWAEAYATLDPETERLLNKITADQITESGPWTAKKIVDYIGRMEEKERASQDNRTNRKFKMGSMTLDWRRIFRKIVEFLKKYIAVGDIASSFDPTQAALPWAALRFILQSIISAQEQSESLLNLVENIPRLIYIGHAFESAYNPKTLSIDDPLNKKCLDDLNNHLVKLYKAIFDAVVYCGKLLRKHRLSRNLASIFNSSEIKGTANGLSDLESIVQKSAELVAKLLNKATSARLLDHLKYISSCSKTMISPIFEAVTDREMCDDLESISKIQFRARHDAVSRYRVSGTGEWILTQREFNAWKTETVSSVLLLYGDGGTGKTYLVSSVIDHIIQNIKDSHAVAYFYCNREYLDKVPSKSGIPETDGDHILCSLVRQLSLPREAEKQIHRAVKGISMKLTIEGSQMNTERCRKLLPEIIDFYQSTTIILDALDECSESSRHDLLEVLEKLLGTTSCIKIFISSRKEPAIMKRLRPRHVIDLQKGANATDIVQYAKDHLSQDPRWHKLNQELRDHMILVLRERSKGMFQWAALQVQEIRSSTTWSKRAIEQQLEALPKDLEEAYDQSWKKLVNPKDMNLRHRLFRWVFCGFKYLPSNQLGWAAQIDPMTDNIDDMNAEFDDQIIYRLGGNLLIKDKETHGWRFCHLSAREYIEKRHFNETQAHQFVSMACLKYLTSAQYMLKGSTDENPTNIERLVSYITSRALQHVMAQDTASDEGMAARLRELLRRFVGSMHTPNEAFIRRLNTSSQSSSSSGSGSGSGSVSASNPAFVKPPAPPIFLLCKEGILHSLAEWWADPSIDLNMCDETGTSLLSIAIKHGREPIWRFLLDNGVDIENGSSLPLEVAASNDRWDVFNELLDRGAKVNAMSIRNIHDDRFNSTALMSSASIGGGGRSSSPLIKAVEWMSDEPVRQIIRGLNPSGDSEINLKDTPRKESLEKLLDAGADVNLVVPAGSGTALASAASWVESGAFRLLLDRGANIHLNNGYESPLTQTLDHLGTPSAVKQVLGAGAHVNQVLSLGGRATALSSAVRYYHPLPVSMVEVLLKAGANPNVGNRRNNSLCSAVESGSVVYVKLLLEHGADPSALLEEGLGSPLAVAAYHRHEEACNILLNTGKVDVNARLRSASPNVLFAAMAGHEFDGGPHIPELLLKRGADLWMPLNASLGSSLFQLPMGHTSPCGLVLLGSPSCGTFRRYKRLICLSANSFGDVGFPSHFHIQST